ncbi:diacylglycerol/lipid kinase family protein [Cellulomonas fimi]|uniref:Diacylglycerol kinase catalytic region n=1 Tax=Cellulomonas fimi (strain ATCC 484 / DSM 20113 / JCM 1341 / CCUG 24087 / LMG 16345 / NBRC 15513 / NCIMB 8980 / NCTC 7547 / NRS-133) TaxID=590998 RepID=F4H3P6_CELFA|nr:diacylglycerol kinase family protein [Cellulomonas fimi]AEE47712.1 diacylglycerol kinase catalytic region [Cellulomonas fimi ATCC 484]NNH09255.1 diacylglycerol kinase [Cellulomonas fimi]VEH36851.1 Diacylglycerol kinase [Cellulomonas fimi]
MAWEGWVAVVAGVLALAALGIALLLWVRQRELRRRIESPGRAQVARALRLARDVQGSGQLVAFVANPSKPDVAHLRAAVVRACADQLLPEPLWLETTVEDPGVGQTRAAVDQGADVVVAIGGDGTVRAVAEGLVGTGVPMGLIPLGTGNLLARNLDLPLSDPLAALHVALDGRDRTIDVGWLRVLRFESDVHDDVAEAADDLPDDTDLPRDHIFLVIAGVGFDAAMVADTDEQLKARVGWIAYFFAGMRHLHGRRTRVHVRLDDQQTTTTRLRSLLIGNCGRLPGGITLLPDAELDDGWLDVAAIDTRAGIAGWAQLLGEVVLQGVGVRNELPAKIGRIDHTRAQEVRLVVPGGDHVQVDGDVVGRVTELRARVDPGALVVRVPSA